MRLLPPVVLMVLMALNLTGCGAPEAGTRDGSVGQPPVADKQPKTITVHGDSRIDNYFWLREKDNPKVMSYLRAEDAYADAIMRPTTAFRDALFKEIVGHIKEDDDTAPYRRGDYFYFTRTVKGLQYPIYLRKKESMTAPEEVIVDLNELAKHQSFMALGAFAPSDDGRLLAYSTDSTGYRQYTLHVKDLSTGMLLPDTAERVGGIEWATDNRTLFFTTEDAVTKRSDKFFRHELGSQRTDLIYEEKDELFDLAVRRSRDGAIIFMESVSRTSTESGYLPANKPTAPLEMIVPRALNHEYDVEHRGDLFYIRTNRGAKNFRVVTAPSGRAFRGALDRAHRSSPGGEDRDASIRLRITSCCLSGRTGCSSSKSSI